MKKKQIPEFLELVASRPGHIINCTNFNVSAMMAAVLLCMNMDLLTGTFS